MPEKQYPEPTVGVLILNLQGEIMLVDSHKWNNKYSIPGGHIELGETAEQTCIREVKEETNLDIYDIKYVLTQECVYDTNFYKKKHFIFLDYIAKTDKTDDIILNEEHEDYIWINPQESLKLSLNPYTKKLIEKYLEVSNK